MDSFIVWILMSAGAAVALLGLFLVISERELKTKRREIEQLLTKLEKATASPAGAARSDAERGEAREQTRDPSADLQAEIVTLRQTLSSSQARIQELEAAQRKIGELESLEADHSRERQSLVERIAELERHLSEEQGKPSELQNLRDRLAEAENRRASLEEAIRRHEAEIPGWQARLAAAEGFAQRLAGLQQPCNDLLTRQAALAEGQRRFQEELAAFAQLIGTAVQPNSGWHAASSALGACAEGNSAATAITVVPNGLPVASEAAEPK